MSILKNIFENLKQSGRKAFIPFITAGDGGLDNTEALIFSFKTRNQISSKKDDSFLVPDLPDNVID